MRTILFCLLLLFFVGCQKKPAEQATGKPVTIKSESICPPVNQSALTPAYQQRVCGTVILDAGHGGKDSGAVQHQVREKDVALAVTLEAANILRSRGVTVHLTRSDDRFISLADRSAYANRLPKAAFISVHTNSVSGNKPVSGIETYVLSNQFTDQERASFAANRFKISGESSIASRQALANITVSSRANAKYLAASVQQSMVAQLGDSNRGVKTANFAVLRETYLCPAVLVELGFISHYPTAKKMTTPAWRSAAARALADGICNYLNQAKF